MAVNVTYVVEALSQLGGTAHWTAIAAKVREIAPDPPKNVESIVRARLQESCLAAKSFRAGAPPDLFISVHGVDARKGVWRLKSDVLSPDDRDGTLDATEAEFETEEGRATLRVHMRRERSRKLIQEFKASLESFACEACGDDMEAVYGPLGAGYIEAHHRVPVALIEEGSKTRLSDLAALCANCHRIVHRNGLMSVEALAAHMHARRPSFAIAAEPGKGEWLHDPSDGSS